MTWGPRRPLVWVAGAATLGMAILATLYGRDGDAPGAFLLWTAAVAFAALTAYGTLLNPRLYANDVGIALRMISGERTVEWPDVQMRVAVNRRMGRDTRTLELELPNGKDTQLVVLGQLELGAEPDDVLADLTRLRSGG